MAMVEVRVVRMSVREGGMEVPMGMRFRSVPGESVLVPVMLIVDVRMDVLLRLVHVLVLVSLGYVKPDPERHEARGERQRPRQHILPDDDRDDGAEEWADGEVGAGPRRAEVPQREDEQDETHTIAGKAHDSARHPGDE